MQSTTVLRNRKLSWRFFMAFAGISAFLSYGTFTFFQSRAREIVLTNQMELNTIVDLKVAQIVQWKEQWISHGNVYMHDKMLHEALHAWRRSPNNQSLKKNIIDWMELQKKYVPFMEAHLCDSNGAKLLSSLEIMKPLPAEMVPFVRIAKESHAIQLTDFHGRAHDNKVHLDMVVPVWDTVDGNIKTEFLLVFSIDPNLNLFPLIQSWPTPSKTSETLLFHRENGDVVYINELRHKKNAPLSLRIPITKPKLPATMALKGYEGIYEGIDYRDKPVVASIKHIPDSPWYLIAKIDTDEMNAPLRRMLYLSFIFIIGIIAVTAMLIMIIERNRSSKYYRGLYEAQQKTQAALRESEEFVRTIISSAQEGVIVYDRDFRYKVWNGFMERITGMPFASLEGKKAFDLFPHLREQGVDTLLARALAGETVQSPDTPFSVPSTGKKGWVFSTYGPHRTANGDITGVVGIVKEITDRKIAEDEIAAKREQLAVTLRSIGDGVISTDNTGRVLLMNRVAENLTGWTLREAEGKPLAEVFQIINDITRAPCENPVEKVLKTGSIIALENHTLLISRDGREMVISDSGAPIRDKNSNTIGVVLVFRDSTERQRALETMIKTEKLESIGMLAGGIAHDFNNLLSGIFGYIDLAREAAGNNGAITDPLLKALKVFNRTRDLTKQLLTFSKGGAPSKKITQVGSIISEMARFALSGSNIKCNVSIPNDLWNCNVDENQIGQVIDNIVINAQQAMPQGGEITLSAENVFIHDNKGIPLTSGKYVKISIHDQGVGIPHEHLRKIFDPFFTTKQKGSGLGLATSFSIIQKHDGFIDVESELGKGATFIVYLPASEASGSDGGAQEAIIHTGTGRILVMDDEEFLRDVAQDMLVRMGYEVVQASCGEEAVALVMDGLDSKKPIRAAILDLTVPGRMGGKETVLAIRKVDPAIKAIASSGYSDDPVMAAPESFGFDSIIKKPYLKEELAFVLYTVFSHEPS